MSIDSQPAAESLDSAYRSPPLLSIEPRPHEDSIYDRAFWLVYIANMAFMIANTLLIRYADFVTSVGGKEFHLGWIVGVGMIGSLAMRWFQGSGIDRYGPRKIWVWSLLLFIASLLAHLAVQRHDTPAIYLLRIALSTSIAGAFGASITYVSRSMPVARMAEVIGTLGTSGFIAMAIGPQLGDLVCGSAPAARGRLDLMFVLAAAMGAITLVCAVWATRGEAPPHPRRRPPVLALLRRYHPGAVLMMGIVIGVGVPLPNVFLPTYAAELKLAHIGVFFTIYAITAFATRLLTRRFPARFGVEPMIYLGLAALVTSLACYLLVSEPWQWAVPGLFGGIAHALLFPSVVAKGSAAFPNRYRGLGTTVMLASLDFGALVGAPLAGGILKYSRAHELPPYPTMFLSIAACLAAVGAIYSLISRRSRDSSRSTAASLPRSQFEARS